MQSQEHSFNTGTK